MKAVRNHAQNMKTRIIQPLFAQDEAGLYDSFQWTLDALERCDPSLDLIVLPEFSDFPGLVKTRDAFLSAVSHNNARLLAACAATARRCGATLFVNALSEEETGYTIRLSALTAEERSPESISRRISRRRRPRGRNSTWSTPSNTGSRIPS